MPYYLSPIEEIPGARRPSRVPRRYDEPGANWIYFRDRAVLWLPSPISDPLLTQIVVNNTDKPSLAARNAMQTFLGDRVISASWDFMDILLDMLRNPMGQSWGELKPSLVRQRNEIWLGPGGRGKNLFWSEAVVVEPHSNSAVDNFTRTAGNLHGSTSSDSKFTWNEIQGTIWTTDGTKATATNIPATTWNVALADLDMDTNNLYAQITLVTFTRATNTYLNFDLATRMNSGITSGYSLQAGIDGVNAAFRKLIHSEDDTLLAGDAVDSVSSTGGVFRLEADGTSIQVKLNGAVILGPVTDSVYPGGAGNRKAFFAAYSAENSTNDLNIDDFSMGDLVAGPTNYTRSLAGALGLGAGTVRRKGALNRNQVGAI